MVLYKTTSFFFLFETSLTISLKNLNAPEPQILRC